MKLKKINSRYLGIMFLVILTLACKNDKKQEEITKSEKTENNVIEVVTTHMNFQTRDTLKSGWNTFA